MHDLADKDPKKLAALKARWRVFAEKANFLPANGGRGRKKPAANKRNKKRKGNIK